MRVDLLRVSYEMAKTSECARCKERVTFLHQET
jgi:hypothetical protein